MHFVVENYMPIVDAIQQQVEQIEDAVQTSAGTLGRQTIRRIAALRRDLLRLRRGAAPLLDVCTKLQRFGMPFIDEEIRPYYADVHDHVIRVAPPLVIKREEIDWAFDRIKKVLERRN